MDKENNYRTGEVRSYRRIADALEEILRMVKLDQEKMEKARLREPDDIKGDW
jgi:hypothetical protein